MAFSRFSAFSCDSFESIISSGRKYLHTPYYFAVTLHDDLRIDTLNIQCTIFQTIMRQKPRAIFGVYCEQIEDKMRNQLQYFAFILNHLPNEKCYSLPKTLDNYLLWTHLVQKVCREKENNDPE